MYVDNVADEFVREYYTRLYSRPSSLYQLYAADAKLVHGEEGMEPYSARFQGEAPVQQLLESKDFGHSKVCITDVTALRSAPSSIVAVVLGDMRHDERPPRMFVQTFVLHEDPKRGPLVLTDILKFLQEDGVPSPLTPDSEVDERTKLDGPSDVDAPSQEEAVEEREPRAFAEDGKPAEDAKQAENPAASLPSPSPASEAGSSEDPETSQSEAGDSSKPRKFKFSFDTIAKAPSFRPKSSVPPAYPVPYSMGAYSPTYSPTPSYQTIPPHLQMQQVPFQYQMPHQFVPPMHGHGPQPVVSGRAFLELSSDEVTSDQVSATLRRLASYRNLKIDAPRKRGYADFFTPDVLLRLAAGGPIQITDTSATVTVKPARPGPRRGDSNDA